MQTENKATVNAIPDYMVWWNGLSIDEQTRLCQNHFMGIPIDTLMDRSIKVMYRYEHPIKEQGKEMDSNTADLTENSADSNNPTLKFLADENRELKFCLETHKRISKRE